MKTRTRQKTYSFYCDESGSFSSVDTHVICPLIVEEKVLVNDDMCTIWKDSFHTGSWENFHAKNLGIADVLEVLERMIPEMFGCNKASAAYIFHRNTQAYQYDIYYALLFKFFLWFSTLILNSEDISRRGRYNLNVNLKIYLAERSQLNQLKLTELLQHNFNNIVRDYQGNFSFPQYNISFNTNVFYLPASASPFIQVSDLLSYVVRKSLEEGFYSQRKVEIFLKSLQKTEVNENELNTDEFKALRGKWQSDKNVPALRLGEAFSQVLLNSLPALIKEEENVLVSSINTQIESMLRYDQLQQMNETSLIRLAAEEMILKNREFLEGSVLIQFLQQYIGRVRMGASDVLTQYLDKLEVQTAAMYLAVNNHQGHFPMRAQCVKDAEITADKLKQDIACWPMVCNFYNNESVSLHNVFDFSGATAKLFPMIKHLEMSLKNPFTGSVVKCYEIGAFFGSYAQTLAFNAHCMFFGKIHDKGNLLILLKEAEYYSLLATEHFTEAADHERQITYQIHFKLQAFILTGDQNCLNEANILLESDGKTKDAIEAFIVNCPERSMLNPAYRVSVALKTAYLSRKQHPRTAEMIKVVLENQAILPQYHPIEQIVAYLALMAEQPNQVKQLGELLGNLTFPPNIVKTIQLIMQLQVAYHLKQPITESHIQAVKNSVSCSPNIYRQWREYKLIDVLKEYTSNPNRWHVGPMDVLPFNYS
jgi:hypothetical protein